MKKHIQSAFLIAVFFVSAWLPASSYAAVASSAFDQFMWVATGGASQTVGYGTGGQPIATSAPSTITTDGGLPKATSTGTLSNPSGSPIAVTATSRIPALEVGKAVGRFAVKSVGAFVVGNALYDLGVELLYIVKRDMAGNLVVQKQAPSTQLWSSAYYWGAGVYVRAESAGAACVIKGGTWSGTSCLPGYYIPAAAGSAQDGAVSDSSLQSLTDAVAAKSGWPSTSAISRVLADPAASADAKIKVDPATTSLSGPATSQGKKTVTTNTTDNTTKTEQVTHNHTYQGSTVTTTNVTNTTIINNTTGAIVEQSTKTEDAKPVEDYTAVDTALPDQPKLYEPKYKDGITGVWEKRKAELTASPLMSLVPKLMPNIGNGGQCPHWNVDLDIGFRSYGSTDIAPPCYLWDIGKVITITGALLLASALVFGG